MTWMQVTVLTIFVTLMGQPISQGKGQPSTRPGVPIVYGTDLFHPHDDPDDHFDLATLMSVPGLDVKGVLLDLGDRQESRPGSLVLRQMFALTGREFPYATGLAAPLQSPGDTGRGQPAADQAAVELLIKLLRESHEPITVIMAGSLRDLCAAFNREPELCRQKIARLYINIGHADGGEEWNVGLDPQAYVGIMRSGLPIYWCPCQPFRDPRSTFWDFDQAEVLDRAPVRVQNFFIYALQVVPPELIDPVEALDKDFRPFRHLVWKMRRQMWCTASFLHAAGLQPVKSEDGSYKLVPEAQAADRPAPFAFVAARVKIDEKARTRVVPDAAPNMHVFKAADTAVYDEAMTRVLAGLLERFPLDRPRR